MQAQIAQMTAQANFQGMVAGMDSVKASIAGVRFQTEQNIAKLREMGKTGASVVAAISGQESSAAAQISGIKKKAAEQERQEMQALEPGSKFGLKLF